MSDIRDNLRQIFEDRGLVQAKFAKRVEITPVQISGILNKKRRLEANELFCFCDALNMSPKEIQEYPGGAKGPAMENRKETEDE